MDLPTATKLPFEFFANQNRKFAIVGGYALLAHGIQRATFDLDLLTTVDLQERFIDFLEENGYETLHRSTGFSNHLHPNLQLGRLDIVYVDDQTATKIFQDSTVREIFPSISALVPKPGHLIAMKVRAIKNDPVRQLQDLADIQKLAHLPNVDRTEVHDYFKALDLEDLYDIVDAKSR